jgi:hypothetical protein
MDTEICAGIPKGFHNLAFIWFSIMAGQKY